VNYVWEQRKFSELYKKVNEKNIFRFGVDKIISVANMYFKEDVKKPNDEYMRTYNIMRLGDIAFEGNKSKNFSHGRFVENTIGDGIVSHVFDVFRPVMDYDLLFWKYLINNENVMGRIMTRCTKASTMMTNLVAKDFLNENILVPTIEEQHKIGTYIDKLDHLITLHQRKIYIFIKKMPIDWEQRKVGDYLTESREIGNKGDVARKMTVKLWGKGVYEKLEAGSTNTQYFIRHANQFIYSKLDFLNCAFGVVPEELESLETTADVPAFDCVYMNPYFMFYRTIQPSFYIQNGIIANGSRKAKRIHTDTFLEMPISVPCLTEQNKIVGYFQSLDHLITLHQHKCDEMKKLKKCMLQKMFPQNGKKVPEIRFEGFTNDWEQRKLGDVLSLLKDGTHGTHRDAESGPLLLSAKNIKNGTVQWDESDRRISEDEYNIIHSNFRLQKGDVLLTIVGSIGEVAILSQSEGVTFQRSVAFLRPSDEICSEFLYSEIQGQKFQKELNDRKSTSAQPGMYLGDLGAIPIEFPTSDEEQMQIGSYFSTIDHLITLHQHKCDELQNLKKYMLQNMFV